MRINIALRGEPAEWLRNWVNRGLVISTTDAILLAFRVLHNKILEEDLKEARLRALRNLPENRAGEEPENVGKR